MAAQEKPKIKSAKAGEEALKIEAVEATAIDFSPISRYEKAAYKYLLKTASTLVQSMVNTLLSVRILCTE